MEEKNLKVGDVSLDSEKKGDQSGKFEVKVSMNRIVDKLTSKIDEGLRELQESDDVLTDPVMFQILTIVRNKFTSKSKG